MTGHKKDTTKEMDKKDEKIEELKKNLAEMENNWKRALADYRNLEKRFEEEKLEFFKYANSTLILRFLPVLDNLELMEKHLDDPGIRMIIQEFKKVFAEEGVSEVETTDKDFDELVMEAVEMVDGPKNKVMDVVQKGYFLKEKLIRPARVKVGNSNASENQQNDSFRNDNLENNDLENPQKN